MGYTRVRGETRLDVYAAVEQQVDNLWEPEPAVDARHMADFADLIGTLLEEAAVLRVHGGSLAAYRQLYTEAAARCIVALDSLARRPGGRG